MSTDNNNDNVKPLSIGVWLSVKKWNEMKGLGLFDSGTIMSASHLLENHLGNDKIQCPVEYHQLEVENASVLSQQQDSVEGKQVKTAKIDQFEVLLHKNSETMANSLYFQIDSSLNEYSALLKQLEDQTAVLEKQGKKLVLVDDFLAVEQTLDRCAIYNAMMKYIPVGDGANSDAAIPAENKGLLKTPLRISLPPSVLLYQPPTTLPHSPSPQPHLDSFELNDVTNAKKNAVQKELLPCNAMTPKEVARYPLFFDVHGDGSDALFINSTNPLTDLKPSVLCLKSPLSSGSSISHAMVLSHNAVQSQLVKRDDDDDIDENKITPTQYQPPSIFYSLPPGLHLLTHVSPHHKVYKVYVIGDIVEVECRDSIDVRGMHQRSLLTFQAQQFKQLCEYTTAIFQKHPKPQSDPVLMKEFKEFAAKLQLEYQLFIKQQKEQKGDSKGKTQEEPCALYFNSQYMKMHMYTGSTSNDLLHSNSNTNNNDLPVIEDEIISKYLHNVLDGSVQPLLSIFPNPLTQTTPTSEQLFDNKVLYPTIDELYPGSDGRYKDSKPITTTIMVSQRKVIPPYLPASDTYEHARSESVVTSSKVWSQHVAIRKLLKSLWKVDDVDDVVIEDVDDNTVSTNSEIPTKLNMVDLKDDNNIDTKEFKDTIKAMAKLLQDNIGLTLFGFDVVQNYYTKSLTVIDVNYFPAYTAVKNFPTRVALEILKKYQQDTGNDQ